MEKNKFCQSCGMPLSKDPEGGGANADGTKSTLYCSYCYQNGAFRFIGNVKEFQKHCQEKMVEGGHGRFMSWLLTRNLRRLQRWHT